MHNEAARYINDKNLNGSQQNLTEVTLVRLQHLAEVNLVR